MGLLTLSTEVDAASLQDFVYWLDAWGDHVLRSASLIEEANLTGIDADVFIQRGKNFLE